ncbi:MAG: hypothetical protein FWB90_06850, partial [Fibromonadales bacterium]|nr:hypothetical protein [Fibromonadales bacterium]
IRASNPDQKLLPGMTANCDIIVEEAIQVLTIPMRALQFKPDENTPGYVVPKQAESSESPLSEKKRGSGKRGNQNRNRVWVLSNEGSLQNQRVNLGLSDGTKIHVIEGLDAKTPVATGVQAITEEKNNQTTNPFMPQKKTGGTKMRM